ncbi:MAG: CoB--CoM heterodisulfide reductase iron-sulfur subunit B family protein [Pseudomonadota bacterium]
MKISYYPGCSLHGTAKEYDESTRVVCQGLDIDLVELEDWNCCGASSAHSTDEFLSNALPGRNLRIARKAGLDLLVPCAACYCRMKTAEKEDSSGGEATEIKNLPEFLVEESNINRIKEHIKMPLEGIVIASYYGCLLTRPPKITEARDYENPQSMDELVELLGGESVFWPYKTECCGGSLALTHTDIVKRRVKKIIEMAIEAGAECLVTACPMCQANLDGRQDEIGKEEGKEYYLPIFYITELVGVSLKEKKSSKWWKRHFVDPRPLLSSKGFI